jgi:hypothetical protein
MRLRVAKNVRAWMYAKPAAQARDGTAAVDKMCVDAMIQRLADLLGIQVICAQQNHNQKYDIYHTMSLMQNTPLLPMLMLADLLCQYYYYCYYYQYSVHCCCYCWR